MVSVGLIEAWLAAPEKSWHRQPSYIESIGIQELISRDESIPAIAQKRQERADQLARRRREWAGRTTREIMAMEGLSQVGVGDYARKNQIAIRLEKRGRKSNPTNAERIHGANNQ
jgi:hypothetical protein